MTDFKLTPLEVRAIIKDRYPGLLSSGALEVGYQKNILTLSGSIMAVSAIERHTMRDLYPNHCRFSMRLEDYEKKRAVYTYKF